MSNKYPRIAGRMANDAIDLRRAVAELTNAITVARKDASNGDSHRRVWFLAGEVERLATCIRADAMSVTEAVPQA
jgi:hypothetical protein